MIGETDNYQKLLNEISKVTEKMEKIECKLTTNNKQKHNKSILKVDSIYIFDDKNNLNLVYIGLIEKSNMIKIISMNCDKFIEMFNDIENIEAGTTFQIKNNYTETKKQGIKIGSKWIIQK